MNYVTEKNVKKKIDLFYLKIIIIKKRDMSAQHKILAIVDEHKEVIGSGDYLKICDLLMKTKKKVSRQVTQPLNRQGVDALREARRCLSRNGKLLYQKQSSNSCSR